MGYKIEACLENGKPSLKIYDWAKGELCLSWSYQGDQSHNQSEINRLFKDLLLLTCKQEIRNVRIFKLQPGQ